MRIAYVTIGSATDLREWSGLNRHILEAIRNQRIEVEVVDKLGTPRCSLLRRLKARYYRHVCKHTFAGERDGGLSRYWAKQLSTRLQAAGPVSYVVSPSTLPVASLPSRFRTAIWADATFHSLRSTYLGARPLCKESVQSGDRLERAALEKATLVSYASAWAACDAEEYYGADPRKLAVIPFGANCPPAYSTLEEARQAVRSRARGVCELLFVGVDWERKGGPMALNIAKRLNQVGISGRLTIAGCNPFSSERAPAFVECRGFLSRSNPDQCQRLDEAFRRTHFLVMPAIAECYGLVYAEAAAYAVPSVARNVGGVGSVVKPGTNGWLLGPEESVESYCKSISNVWQDYGRYEDIAMRSYVDWGTRLNWGVAGASFVEMLKRCLEGGAVATC